MKNIPRVLIGGALVVCGCEFFLYPNYREWRTQREVTQIIESFDKTYDEGITSGDSGNTKKDEEKKSEVKKEAVKEETKESDNSKEKSVTATPAEDQDSGADESAQTGQTNGDKDIKTSNKEKPYQKLYDKMLAYNKDLSENGQYVSDAWNYEQQPFDLTELGIDSSNPIIGYIEAPDMKIRLPLMLGASTQNLENGAAVLSGTSMPIGGDNTNCVIAGHRGWEGSAYFQYIENMKVGSRVYVTNPWETLVYECVSTKVIDPNDVDSILIQKGKDMITLLSCHPYVLGGGPYRYLVYCERVDTQERKETDSVLNPKGEPVEQQTTTTSKDKDVEKSAETGEMNKDDIQKENNISASTPINIQNAQDPDEIDLLALEQTLRFILPISAILLSVFIVLMRNNQTGIKKKKKKKKKNKSNQKRCQVKNIRHQKKYKNQNKRR